MTEDACPTMMAIWGFLVRNSGSCPKEEAAFNAHLVLFFLLKFSRACTLVRSSSK